MRRKSSCESWGKREEGHSVQFQKRFIYIFFSMTTRCDEDSSRFISSVAMYSARSEKKALSRRESSVWDGDDVRGGEQSKRTEKDPFQGQR